MIRDLYSFILLAKLMVLLRQILFTQAIAVTAEAILMRVSAEQMPSLHRIAPKDFMLVTSPNLQMFSAARFCYFLIGENFVIFCVCCKI